MQSWNWQKIQEVLCMIATLAIFIFLLVFHSLTENHVRGRVTHVKRVERMIVVQIQSGASFMIDAQWQQEPITEGETYKFVYRNGFLYPRTALRIEHCSDEK
ncbi:hypothetical protein FJZ28_02800 [Candidatus Peregrinibacteria bacterium]|nr:hypothetical protein [Candidatus Peregrinibacteria bacterium]